MAQKSSRIAEVDRATIWVLTDNYYDALRPDLKMTNRYRTMPGKSMHAEHGLAYYVETSVDGEVHSCMFDFGLDAKGVMNNMAILGIDIGKASAFVLSHGHFDHYFASLEILKSNQANIEKEMPFYVGDEAFSHRFSLRPGCEVPLDLGQLRRQDLEVLGLKVIEVNQSVQIIPGVYTTGHINRITEYEKPNPSLLIKRNDKLDIDDFRGEQALFFQLKKKGLVVLSGCAHPGIVNTVRQAQKASGTDKVFAVMGGFHLISAGPENLRQTIADIKAMKPECIVPMHCTGFEAIAAFLKEMPDQSILNTAGTKYTFQA